ncbi:MAG: TRAP transporter small permease [Nitrososphaerota archaeon]
MSGVSVLAMSLLNTFEVIMRSVFNRPTLWTLPLCQYLLLCVAFLGASFCLQTDGHVSVEFFIERLNKRLKLFLLLMGYGVSMVYIGVLLYYSVHVAVLSGRFGWEVVTTFPIPAVILYTVMIAGLVALLMTFVSKIGESLKEKK